MGHEERQKRYREEYLKSKHWQGTRKAKLKIDPKCESCGEVEQLEVHHKHYRSLYHETRDDLETLCSLCHRRRHGIDPLDNDTLKKMIKGM